MLGHVFELYCSSRSENQLEWYVFLPTHCPDTLIEKKHICPIVLMLEAGAKFSLVSSSNEHPFLIQLYACVFPKPTCEKRLKFEVNDLLIPGIGGKKLVRLQM